MTDPPIMADGDTVTIRGAALPMLYRAVLTNMPPTTNFADCQRFAESITAAGGTVPGVLANLLSSYEVLSSPAATQRPEDPHPGPRADQANRHPPCGKIKRSGADRDRRCCGHTVAGASVAHRPRHLFRGGSTGAPVRSAPPPT